MELLVAGVVVVEDGFDGTVTMKWNESETEELLRGM